MTCKNDFVTETAGSQSTYDELITQIDSFNDVINFQNNISGRIDSDKSSTVTAQFNQYLSSEFISLDDYPTIENRINLGPFTGAEVATFLGRYKYDIDGVIERLGFEIGCLTCPVKVKTFVATPSTISMMAHFDDFLDHNVAAATSGNFCNAFSDTFVKLSQLYNLASSTAKTIDELKNIDASGKEILSELVNKFTWIIDSISSTMSGRAELLLGALRNIDRLPTYVAATIFNEYVFTSEFYQNAAMILVIKQKVEELVAGTAGQYEQTTPEVIALTVFRACQIMNIVDNYMMSPINNLQNSVDNVENMFNATNASFSIDRIAAGSTGAFNISPDEALRLRSISYKNHAGGASQPSRRGGLTSPNRPTIKRPSSNELIDANTFTIVRNSSGVPTRVYNKWFELSPKVIEVGYKYNDDNTYALTCGWTEVKTHVWAKAAQLSDRLGAQLYINSAFRSPSKNASLNGAAKHSWHMTGLALDISTRSTNFTTEDFVRHANLVGFKGIGYYSTFIHVDARDNSLGMWQNATPNTKTAENLNIHRFPQSYGYFKDDYVSTADITI